MNPEVGKMVVGNSMQSSILSRDPECFEHWSPSVPGIKEPYVRL